MARFWNLLRDVFWDAGVKRSVDANLVASNELKAVIARRRLDNEIDHIFDKRG